MDSKNGRPSRQATPRRTDGKPKRFQIVKLEPRIAPKLSANHNETMVRDVR